MKIKTVLSSLILMLILGGCAAASSDTAGMFSDTSSGVAASGTVAKNTNTTAAADTVSTKPLHIAMATDLHYQPEVSDAASSLIPQMKYISQLTDCLLEEVVGRQPDVLLLCGDLTNNGLRNEHEALIKKLDLAKSQGTRILVIPGNHDLKGVSQEEFAKLYADYGYATPLMRDTASLSYVAPLTDSFWLLMLDTNISNTYGGVSDDTLSWVQHVLEQADEAGAVIVTSSHHNLLGHSSPQYNQMSPFENRDALLSLLEMHQVPLNISGHLHKQHTAMTTFHGGSFYEITGGMPADYPNLWTDITVTPDTRSIACRTHSLDMEGWAAAQGSGEEELLHFSDYSRACRQKTAEGLVGGMLRALGITGGDFNRLESFWSKIYMDASDGLIRDTGKDYLASDDYRIWQQYQDKSKYSEWLDYLLQQKGAVDSHSLLIKS